MGENLCGAGRGVLGVVRAVLIHVCGCRGMDGIRYWHTHGCCRPMGGASPRWLVRDVGSIHGAGVRRQHPHKMRVRCCAPMGNRAEGTDVPRMRAHGPNDQYLMYKCIADGRRPVL